MFKKRFFGMTIIIGVILLMVFIGCDFLFPEQTPESFTIKNNTGDYLSTLHFRTPGSLIWSSGTNVWLSNGGSTSVTNFNDRMDDDYQIDIQLRTSNGNLYTKLSYKLTHAGTVTFTSSDLDSESPRTISIGNVTGDYLSTVHLKEPGTSIWSSGSNVWLSNGGSTSLTIPRNHMNSQYRTDIQLRTSNGNLYTKLSQTITHNGEIVFTSSDLDDGSSRTITIGNITGDYLSTVHIKVPGTSIWSSGSNVWLSNGGSASVTIPNNQMDSQFRTDIQLRTSNGNLYTRLSQTITHNGTITFSSSNLDSESPRTISFGNNTGEYLSTIHLKVPGTTTWSSGSNVWLSNGGSASVTIPRNMMDSMYRTDIQFRTSGGVTFTRTYQTIPHNGNITFSSSDRD